MTRQEYVKAIRCAGLQHPPTEEECPTPKGVAFGPWRRDALLTPEISPRLLWVRNTPIGAERLSTDSEAETT